jgi:hypothetical protein
VSAFVRGGARAAPSRESKKAFARQVVRRVAQVADGIRAVSFMHYDLGFFDHETCRLEPVANPFQPEVLPMSPV